VLRLFLGCKAPGIHCILGLVGTAEALEYARTHFAVFQDTFMPEIKQLMCCLLFSSRAITDTPYRSLETKQLHADVTAEFVKEACGLLGQVLTMLLLPSSSSPP
jgi:hypothetical protein